MKSRSTGIRFQLELLAPDPVVEIFPNCLLLLQNTGSLKIKGNFILFRENGSVHSIMGSGSRHKIKIRVQSILTR